MSEEPEINIDGDDLIANILDRNAEDAERASSAGESRAALKMFLEDSGVHPKALSAMRVGMKIKKEAHRLDWLRSMEAMLPHVAGYIEGQSTPDMFEGVVPMREDDAA